MEPLPAAQEAVAEPEVSQTVLAPESALEAGYESAEPIPEIPASDEQEPIHVAYGVPAEQAHEREPAAISPEPPAAES